MNNRERQHLKKNKVPSPYGIGDLNQFWLYYVSTLVYFLPQTFKIFGFQIFFFFSIPDEGYSRSTSRYQHLYLL